MNDLAIAIVVVCNSTIQVKGSGLDKIIGTESVTGIGMGNDQ